MKNQSKKNSGFLFLKKLKNSLFCKKPFFFLFKNKDLEAAFFMSKGSPFYVIFIILWYDKFSHLFIKSTQKYLTRQTKINIMYTCIEI